MLRGIAVAVAGSLAVLGAGAALAGDTLPGRNGRIAYITVRKGTPRIWTMTPAGTGQRALTRGAGLEEAVGGPAWSPDGRRIAFTVLPLAIMNADGSGKRFLESPAEASQSGYPSFSPDGTRIVYVSDRDGATELWVIPSDGGTPVRLADQATQFEDLDPSWSPDGKRIAFVRGAYSRRTGRYVHDVYAMNADGSAAVNLTRSAADEYGPDWSPDGTQIAFTRMVKTGGQLWTMRADGSSARRLTTGRVSDLQPAWSPDGKLIAFARGLAGHYPFPDATGKFDIHVMNADGSGIRKITRNPDIDAEPAWQPLPR